MDSLKTNPAWVSLTSQASNVATISWFVFVQNLSQKVLKCHGSKQQYNGPNK